MSGGEWSAAAAPHHRGSKTKAFFVLILFRWLREFTPNEAYLVPFLTRVKPFTEKQVSIDIFPYGVYATLVFTLLAAPACHLLTYRAVIIIGTLSKVVTFVLLYYTESLFIMQLSQITYGLGMTSNLVLSSYIFILFSEEDYQIMTSYTQASSLVSFLMAAELGQFLVDGGVSLVVLLQITLISAVLSCIVSFLLPKTVSEFEETRLLSLEQSGAFQGIWEVIRETWQGGNLRLLSFWSVLFTLPMFEKDFMFYVISQGHIGSTTGFILFILSRKRGPFEERWVFGTAGFAMIVNYGTNLFDEIDPTTNTYGHIVAASQGAGFLGALAGVKVAPLAAKKGGMVYVVGTFTTGLLCLIMGWGNILWIAYPTYVAAIGVDQLLLCLIYVQCAKSLTNREFILLFSVNAAAALLVQSAIQVGVEFLQLSMVHQFYLYGGYCMALATVFWFLCYEHYVKTGRVQLVHPKDGSSAILM